MAKINGADIFFEERGSGPPLLMITGFSVASDCWALVVDALAKHFRVVTFDNRGSGRSEVTQNPYPIKLLADDAMALCKHLGIQKPNVLGSSMGGAIAQTIAHHYPIEKLLLCNTASRFSMIPRLYLQQAGRNIQSGMPIEQIVEDLMLWLFSSKTLEDPVVHSKIRNAIVNQPYPCPPEGYVNQSFALNEFNSTSWLHTIQAKTLVIGSDEDRFTMEFETRALAKAIPGAKYAFIQDCGHNPHLERPDKFLEAVIPFLQESL